MYNREQLIAAVKQEIENVILQYENDNEVTYVDIRLQLVDGTYHIHTGDNQFDSDHRGEWGDGTVVIKPHFVDEDKTMWFSKEDVVENNNGLEEIIVDEALEDWKLLTTF